MKTFIKRVATRFVGARAMSRFGWTWIGYGIAAYYGLRALRRFGIFETQADAGIRFLESGARNARRFAFR